MYVVIGHKNVSTDAYTDICTDRSSNILRWTLLSLQGFRLDCSADYLVDEQHGSRRPLHCPGLNLQTPLDLLSFVAHAGKHSAAN